MNYPDPTVKGHRWGNLARWSVVIIVVTAASIVLFRQNSELASLNGQRDAIAENQTAVTNSLRQLREREHQFVEQAKLSRLHRSQIEQVLRQIRLASEIPPNSSELVASAVVSSRKMNDSMRLSLPEGEHLLSVQVTRTESKSEKPIDQATYEFPLAGTKGYIVDVSLEKRGDSRDENDLMLRVKSSDSDQDAVEYKLVEKPIPEARGSSSSADQRYIFYPNQSDQFQPDDSGVLVNEMEWSFPEKESPAFEIKFEMRLFSDGPEILSTGNPFHFGGEAP